jgi:hypothetical protein
MERLDLINNDPNKVIEKYNNKLENYRVYFVASMAVILILGMRFVHLKRDYSNLEKQCMSDKKVNKGLVERYNGK